MLGIGWIAVALAAAVLWMLFYLYLLHILEFFRANGKSWVVRGAAALAALAGVLACGNIWNLEAAVLLHGAALIVLVDLVNLIGKAVGKASGHTFPRWRKVYRSGVVPLAATVLVLGFAYWNMETIVETGYTVYTPKEIRPEGYRIAMISDLHYNTTMDREKLEEQCRRIQETQPDLLVLCGDLVDENTALEELQEAFEVLGQVESTYGTFFVYGNQDRSRYRPDPNYTEEQLREAIEGNGIRILRDEALALSGELTVIGRDDRSVSQYGSRKSGTELLEGVDTADFLLPLDHQPREYAEDGALGFDLVLSGHTHAGQLWPVGWINQLLGVSDVNYGYARFGDMQAIVSSGIGGWGYPLRTSGRAEFVTVQVLPEG